jgi:hypothetical protein
MNLFIEWHEVDALYFIYSIHIRDFMNARPFSLRYNESR